MRETVLNNIGKAGLTRSYFDFFLFIVDIQTLNCYNLFESKRSRHGSRVKIPHKAVAVFRASTSGKKPLGNREGAPESGNRPAISQNTCLILAVYTASFQLCGPPGRR